MLCCCAVQGSGKKRFLLLQATSRTNLAEGKELQRVSWYATVLVRNSVGVQQCSSLVFVRSWGMMLSRACNTRAHTQYTRHTHATHAFTRTWQHTQHTQVEALVASEVARQRAGAAACGALGPQSIALSPASRCVRHVCPERVSVSLHGA